MDSVQQPWTEGKPPRGGPYEVTLKDGSTDVGVSWGDWWHGDMHGCSTDHVVKYRFVHSSRVEYASLRLPETICQNCGSPAPAVKLSDEGSTSILVCQTCGYADSDVWRKQCS